MSDFETYEELLASLTETWDAFEEERQEVIDHPAYEATAEFPGMTDSAFYGYRVYRIPKKKGWRKIEEPNPELKEIQKGILKVLERFRPSLGKYAHGFLPKRSIVTNAAKHFIYEGDKIRPVKCLLKMDLKDFFPTVTKGMIKAIMEQWNFPAYLQDAIIRFCFIGDRLPQGAPTSPYLANMAAVPMDYRLAGLVKKWRLDDRYQPINYTRYADDLAFSSDYPKLIELVHSVRFVVKEAGFIVNNDKIEFHRQPAQLRICGIVINAKLSVERKLWRQVRAILHGAITDIVTGMAAPGFYIDPEARKEIREAAGLDGKPGLVNKLNLNAPARILADTATQKPIPWEQWQGIVAHIGAVDEHRGDQLKEQYHKLRRISDVAIS